MTRDPPAPDTQVLDAFDIEPESLARAPSGLINWTWYARSRASGDVVLQRVSSIFPGVVNLDIEAVTKHLAAKRLDTPTLVPSREGKLWLERDGAVWRVLTRVHGITRDALASAAQAREAGRVLGTFHHAVSDLRHTFHNARLGVHDTVRHLRALRTALEEMPQHRDIGEIQPLAMRVLRLAAKLPPLPPAGDRIVHGDPKISNVVFDEHTDRGRCLIDLDTLSRMPVALELGDALRSWCNPKTEDASDAHFVQAYFAAAVEGYAAAAPRFLAREEWTAIPAGTLTITVELAARFCADALRESYFRWDDTRYPSASAHNQARTRGQLRLAETMWAELPALATITERAFAR